MLSIWGRRIGWRVGAAILAAAMGMTALRLTGTTPAREIAQDEPAERKGPPELDDMETDADEDGIPDGGWYNARDVSWIAGDGAVGMHFIRFHATEPGRPARLSRAFGIDGRKTEAIILGVWVRQKDIQIGERTGSEPELLIEFFEAAEGQGRALSRNILGPWTHTVGNKWTRVVKRIPVPPDTNIAIMSTGLMGGIGTLDVDGLTIRQVPVGGVDSTNLIVNGDFELGDPAPAYWSIRDARRVFPGYGSSAALELTHAGATAMAPVAIPVGRLDDLDVSIAARCSGLRGGGGAEAILFFLDAAGAPVDGGQNGVVALEWAGTSAWQVGERKVPVPAGAMRAMLQIKKLDGIGSIRVDDVQVTSSPNGQAVTWTPFHVADATDGWHPMAASPEIATGGALDVSFLVPQPAGALGLTTVKGGRLAFSSGGRARFLGVSLMTTTAFLEPERVDAIADRLARSGINLVRLGELEMPVGPGLGLLDDTRNDTKAFDPDALARLDHLIAAMKSRGIYVALELQGGRRFRPDDGVAAAGLLPEGGGPAADFDPTITKLALANARALLDHVNPETGLALREDPALAWVTLAGEMSLFDLIERPESLPPPYVAALHERAVKAAGGLSGRRLWESVESEHSRQMADDLRRGKLRAPIAGVSHWRRDPDGFNRAQSAQGLDLIDDRIFWAPLGSREFAVPEMRSMLWSREGGLIPLAEKKRKSDRPYVIGQWCNQTIGAWSLPTEAGDYLLGVYTAGMEDWDALVRRGLFRYPVNWGEGPAGLVGGRDIFQFPEVINGSPHVYALFPHAASLFHRGVPARLASGRHPAPRGGRGALPGWDSGHGRLVIDTPFTQALVGWSAEKPARLANLEFSTDNEFAVLAASSIGPEPIAEARRLLVTAIGRVEPTGFRWVDRWKTTVADPGRPPFLQEPVRAQVTWRRKGNIKAAFVINNAGEPGVGPAFAGGSSPMAKASPCSSTAGRPASTGSWSSNELQPSRHTPLVDPRTLAR